MPAAEEKLLFPESDLTPLAAIFPLVGEEVRRAVVKRALARHGKKADPRLKQALRNVPVKGHRDASRVRKPETLLRPVMERIDRRGFTLANAVLAVWAESEEDLRERSAAYLRANGVAVRESFREFDSFWPREIFLRHQAEFAGTEDSVEVDAAGLMLCLVAGRFPMSPPLTSNLFEEWKDALDGLDPDAPDWNDVDVFASWLLDIRGRKRREALARGKERAAALCAGLRSEFDADLRYLGVDPDPWPRVVETRPSECGGMLEFLAELRERMEEYGRIRPQAPSRAGEVERAAQRTALEERILKMSARWTELAASPPPAAPREEPKKAEPAPAVEEAPEPDRDLEAEIESLRQQIARSESANDAEIKRLTEEVAEARRKEAVWRDAYEREKRRRPEQADDLPIAITNVREAIEAARDRFPDQLVIALNNKSNADTQYEKPQEVFEALAWLATSFQEGAQDIGEACPGWSYTAHQSEVTMGSAPAWYETRVNGKAVKLRKHIGKGVAKNPRHTIRIAFEREEGGRVVVGFVGQHQRTARS